MITPEQRAARRHHIGSSDIAAIAGCDPWSSPLAVYLQKVYDVEDIENKGRIARGNRWEGPLLDFAQEALGGVELQRNVHVQHPEVPWIAVNLDARLVGLRRREGIEAKTANMRRVEGAIEEEYGEEGTDQVPERVLCQAHLQMDAAQLQVVWVPVLLARFGRLEETLYQVNRNEDLITSLRGIAEKFWHAYVLPKIPPPADGPPALDVIKRIRRISGAVVDVDPALVSHWRAKNALRLLAEKEEEAAKSEVLASLGDSEIGDYGDDQKVLTYFEQTRAAYSVPDGKYRVARISNR